MMKRNKTQLKKERNEKEKGICNNHGLFGKFLFQNEAKENTLKVGRRKIPINAEVLEKNHHFFVLANNKGDRTRSNTQNRRKKARN